AGARGATRLGKQRQVRRAGPHQLHDSPYALHRLLDLWQQRTFDHDREVDSRRRLPRRVVVVDDVDTADEGDLAVDDAELPVQAPQPMRAELPGRDLRPVFLEVDAAVAHLALQRGGQIEL